MPVNNACWAGPWDFSGCPLLSGQPFVKFLSVFGTSRLVEQKHAIKISQVVGVIIFSTQRIWYEVTEASQN